MQDTALATKAICTTKGIRKEGWIQIAVKGPKVTPSKKGKHIHFGLT